LILAIPGSIRKGSYNRLLLQAAIQCASGLAIRIYDELAAIPLFSEDLERKTGGMGPDVIVRFRRQVAEADGLLIATPEYNQSIPGVLKNAIDWLSRPGPEEVLAGKPVAVMGASAGRWGTRLAQAALRQTLYAAESVVLPRVGLYVREAAGVFDSNGRLIDPSIKKQLESLLTTFTRWIEVV
jgi:chromate reductase